MRSRLVSDLIPTSLHNYGFAPSSLSHSHQPCDTGWGRQLLKPHVLDLSGVPPAQEQGCSGRSLGRYLLLSLVFWFCYFDPCNISIIFTMAE